MINKQHVHLLYRMSLQNLNDVADIRKEYPKLNTTLLNISDLHIFF